MFCVFGVVLIAFLLWEWRMGSGAILPLYLFKNRSQVGCCLASFWIMLMFLTGIYYLPLFYQAKVRLRLLFFPVTTSTQVRNAKIFLCFLHICILIGPLCDSFWNRYSSLHADDSSRLHGLRWHHHLERPLSPMARGWPSRRYHRCWTTIHHGRENLVSCFLPLLPLRIRLIRYADSGLIIQ